VRPALRTVLFTSPYVRQARDLFDRFETPPDSERRAAINSRIKLLVLAGLWEKLDAFYWLSGDDVQSSMLNWLPNPSYDLTAINSPAFVPGEGFTGDGGTSYLDTGFNPATAIGAKFTQDSAHLGLWSRTDLQNGSASSFDIGNNNANIARVVSVPGRAGGRANTGTGVTFGSGFYPGHAMFSRTAADVWESYANGVDAGGGNTASVAVTNATIRILGVAVSQYGVNQVAVAHFGGGLTAADALAIRNAIGTV